MAPSLFLLRCLPICFLCSPASPAATCVGRVPPRGAHLTCGVLLLLPQCNLNFAGACKNKNSASHARSSVPGWTSCETEQETFKVGTWKNCMHGQALRKSTATKKALDPKTPRWREARGIETLPCGRSLPRQPKRASWSLFCSSYNALANILKGILRLRFRRY